MNYFFYQDWTINFETSEIFMEQSFFWKYEYILHAFTY